MEQECMVGRVSRHSMFECRKRGMRLLEKVCHPPSLLGLLYSGVKKKKWSFKKLPSDTRRLGAVPYVDRNKSEKRDPFSVSVETSSLQAC